MKIRKTKKVFTAATILGYVPEMLEYNARLVRLRDIRHKCVRLRYNRPRDEEVRWLRIGSYKIPYMWSANHGLWYRSVDCLTWDVPDAHTPSPSNVIPVTFSSEHTASSPRHPGELET